MKTHVLILMSAAMLIPPASSQVHDSLKTLESQILSRPETDVNLLSKTRDALRDAVLASDSAKIAQIAGFIRSRFDTSRYIPLWPREWMLVHYWVGDYDEILKVTREPEEVGEGRMKITPQRDILSEDMSSHSQAQMHHLMAKLMSARRAPHDEDFLRLFLHFLIGPTDESANADKTWRDRINEEADEVLLAHKDSEHNPFIRRNVRYVIRPSEWGGGFVFAIGQHSQGGMLRSQFSESFLLEMAFEGAYRSTYGILGLAVGGANPLRNSFVSEGVTWNKGTKIQYYNFFVGVGVLLDTGPLKMSPHAGLGYSGFEPPEEHKHLPGNDVSLSYGSLVAGVNIDIPLTKSSSVITAYNESGYWYARLRLGWQRSTSGVSAAQGSVWSITLGIGGFARPVVRDL